MDRIFSFFKEHTPRWGLIAMVLGIMVVLHYTGAALTKQAATDKVQGVEEMKFQDQLLVDANDLVKKYPYLTPRLDKAINNDSCLCLDAEEFSGLQTYVQAYEAGRRAGYAGK